MTRCIALLVTVIAFPGCAGTPAGLWMPPGMVSGFETENSITIENAQYGDDRLRAWTNALIELLSIELGKRGARITDQSSLMIRLRITEADQIINSPLYANKCCVSLDLETGERFRKTYEPCQGSALDPQRACDLCVTKLAAAILNDIEMRQYLGIDVDW